MPQVQVIQPIQQQPKRLRVAAYARVSSDSEDQLNSLSVQVDYYTHLIQENPNWDFAGIYTDEGVTGTSTKHREQFNRLLDDCRAGLIDRVDLLRCAGRITLHLQEHEMGHTQTNAERNLCNCIHTVWLSTRKPQIDSL